ncbi:MAG: hypothetical protein FWF80_02140 [Defluviitaleaceae bacterium]|nr:hypothetical protein [Defluviitaleaceae bacterium]
MSWIYRVHLIADEEITGVDERLDRLISLQLHYRGDIKIPGGNKTEKHCYSVEYEPLLGFVSSDYHEMDILQQHIYGGSDIISAWMSQGRRKMSDATISGMEKVLRQILLKNVHNILFQVERGAII